MNMPGFRTLLLVMGLLVGSTATAGALEELKQYYQAVERLQGRFEQVTRNAAGEVLEEAAGQMAIARPNRFRWDYDAPFEQRIIADGERLWVYDVDLEQVTVRPLDEVLGLGPALLLSGDYASLQRSFELRPVGQGWLELTPKDPDWDFQSLRLKMAGGAPAVLQVDDGLGQVTELRLEELKLNPNLPAQIFRFEPPPGVDVVAPQGLVGGEE